MYKGLCFILLGVVFNVSAQKKIYLDLGAGFTSHVIKDDAMSPVRYSGVLPSVSFGTIKSKAERKASELRLVLMYGTIHAKAFREHPTMKGPLFRLDFDYVHLRKTNIIKDSAQGVFYIGGAFHNMIAVRFMQQLDNSAIIYDYASSLGISAAFERSFNWRQKRLRHYHRISVPVVSLASRPDYMNVFDFIAPKENDPLADATERASLRSFGSHQRVIIRNTLFYPIRGSNLLGLTYEWQYYAATFTVPVKSAYHSVMFSLFVRI